MSSIDELRGIVGAAHVLTDADAVAPYLVDWRRRYVGRAQAVVLPATTDEVARIVAWCARTAHSGRTTGGQHRTRRRRHAGRLRPRDPACHSGA